MSRTKDKNVFQTVMAGVTPLKPHRQYVHPPVKVVARKNTTLNMIETEVLPEISVSSDAVVSFARPEIPWQLKRDLKQAKYPIEACIDLHGLTQAEAKAQLLRSVAHAMTRGQRILLVIHGKARGQQVPILKTLTCAVLQAHPDVLAYVSALPKQGGSGALYVLLSTP